MNRVGEFQKVSYEQFYNAIKSEFGDKFEYDIPMLYKELQLPTRATTGSAGYDFKSPFDFSLAPSETITIPTGIRVRIDNGWWLGCFPRSSLGFKYGMKIVNTVPIIDSDYYWSNNEGHIFFKITNCNNEWKVMNIKSGDNFVQGIFIPYGITHTDNVQEKRNGGIGSTGS